MPTQRKRLVFPFGAIVGLDKLKLAILINAINPKIGGLLIRGPKGSGKSTIVRALADILPQIEVVEDCSFSCSPRDPSNMCSKCRERYNNKEKLPIETREMVVVDLPLGSTEDRVIGSLDVEKAIKQGIEALEPGILAEANQNILYVDEVNLLPDHIADDLLDAAATGWNRVEREGISVGHPARFIFIGSMNPEEGELRPQLLDRFSLSVTVETISSVQDRMDVVKRNMEFEADPEKFLEKFLPLQEELKNRIVQARKTLEKVVVPDNALAGICKSCLDLKVDGLRPDIVIAKAAATLAAFENRTEITLEDILVAAELALSHRTREGGFIEPATPTEIREIFTATIKKVFEFKKTGGTTKAEAEKSKLLKGKAMFLIERDATKKEEGKAMKNTKWGRFKNKAFQIFFRLNSLLGGIYFALAKRTKNKPEKAPNVDGFQLGTADLWGHTSEEKVDEKTVKKAIPTVSNIIGSPQVSEGLPVISYLKTKITSPSHFFLKMNKIQIKTKEAGGRSGRRAQTFTTLQRGKPYSWRFPKGKPTDIHMPATIRAAAGKQKMREKPTELALQIIFADIREKLRVQKAPLTMVFVVDLSGSMLLNLGAVKDALLKLHEDAHRFRDRIGIVALKDTGAVIVQHPITNLRVVAKKLTDLRVSGFTPLASGMFKAWEVLKEAKRRDPSTIPVMVVITDGSANVPLRRSLETGEIRHIEDVRIAFREYEDIAVKDVMSVSRLVKREGIKTIVVNTNPHLYGEETYGRVVTQVIAKMTAGAHHNIGRMRPEENMVKGMIEMIKEDQKRIASQGIMVHRNN